MFSLEKEYTIKNNEIVDSNSAFTSGPKLNHHRLNFSSTSFWIESSHDIAEIDRIKEIFDDEFRGETNISPRYVCTKMLSPVNKSSEYITIECTPAYDMHSIEYNGVDFKGDSIRAHLLAVRRVRIEIEPSNKTLSLDGADTGLHIGSYTIHDNHESCGAIDGKLAVFELMVGEETYEKLKKECAYSRRADIYIGATVFHEASYGFKDTAFDTNPHTPKIASLLSLNFSSKNECKEDKTERMQINKEKESSLINSFNDMENGLNQNIIAIRDSSFYIKAIAQSMHIINKTQIVGVVFMFLLLAHFLKWM